ncbi:MAG: putative Ig domain-containing protein, partial [Chromatiales bacterium]|nr:putative Ig domain-containing protein [Chromatiales bacterium]
VFDTFDIVVANANDAPVVANAIPDQAATEDSPFSFQFASNTFSDPDVGDTLSYSASLSDDSALPAWLSFDSATRTFSGTPANADVGTISVKVTADDGNGGTISDSFDIVVANTNDAPVVANPIADQAATQDSAFSFQFAANTFSDPDVGDTLSYSATQADNSALPAWLSFDAATRTFSGTPTNADVGTISVKVNADDGSGITASDTFDIVVANANDGPVVANAIPDQAATEDSAFNFQFASDTFNDPDAGDTLNYSATLTDDSALPAWLSFDAATRTFSGTPTNDDVGTVTVKVTADDGNGGTISDTFDIVVANSNDAPVVANTIPDQAATEVSAFTFQFASNTFSDVDVGDTLSYSATQADDSALPGWLSFDAATRTFSGTPSNADVGTLSVKVTADDGNGGMVSDTFDIVVANTNDVPTVANAIPDQGATEDSAFNFQFASNTFSDPDVGDTLSYSATLDDDSALPAWLSFDAATRTFSGTPTNSDVGTISVKVTTNDGNGGTVSDTFDIIVANTNDAPTVANAIADQAATEDSAFNFQFASNTFSDVDAGDTLSYSATLADDSALPAWLSFDAATRTFSGTPGNADVGTISVKVTADDGNGGTVFDTFDIVVANTNNAPTVANAIGDQAATEDAAFSFQFASNTFSDPDVGDTLTYSATLSDNSALPAWLGFDAATRTFSGTPTNADVGTISIKVTADDGNGGTVSDTFDIVVANTNDAPIVANAIADQAATEGNAFSFQFASNTFSDPDVGDTLTYSATLSDDSALPAWLSFDAATRTFSGTPGNADVGTISVKVTANDGNSGTAFDSFNIVVANTNNAPIVANAIADQAATEDSAFNFQFTNDTFTDADVGDTLTYSATLSDDSALPAWLSFDAATRTFSGTPSNSDVGTISVKVTANDGSGGAVSDTFDVVVANTNDAPTVASPIPDQAATEDVAFSYQFAAGTFADVDVGDTLSYSATLADDSALPAWLSFDSATRTFSGTPTASDVGTISVKVTANDGNGGTVSDTFNLVVGAASNNPPTVANPIANQAATEDSAFNFQFASNTFNDPDVGDTLSYTATLSDDSALPTWLSFDSATRTFSGTPANDDVGTISVKVTANDGSGGAVSDTFDIVVANTNDAPTVASPIPDQAATEDVAFSYPFTAGTFADVDVGDTLSYSATLADDSALPAWLSFDSATRTFSGTPTASDVGTISVKVTANDGNGGTVSDTFDLVVGAASNNPPTVANPIADQAATEDSAFNFQFASNTFSDPDVGDTLTYSATLNDDSAIPAWLSFDSATRTFSGTPTNSDVGTISVKVTANDGNGGTVSDTFTIVVVNSNDAPTIANAIAHQTAIEDTPFTFQFAANTFDDVDAGDTLSYTASGLPAWLNFDPATRTFNGTPQNGDVGTINITVTASDGHGGAVSNRFGIVVTNTNDAPEGSVFIDNPTPEEGDTLTAGNTLTDADGLNGPIGYQWYRDGVQIDGATGTSYTTTAQDVGTVISVVVSYTDDRGTDESVGSSTEAVREAGNEAPTGTVTISGLAVEDEILTAADTLDDPDGVGTVSYQWQRDGADVSGATGTRYALTDDDVGTIITVVARYTDERGHQESVASDPVGPIANVNDPATGDWVITGSATEGQIIFAERRLVADADGLGPFQYQWMRDGSPIAGATGTAYQLSGNDVGAYVYLQVSFVDGHGTNETMTSAGIVPQPLLTPELIDLLDSATQSAVNEPSTSTAGSSPPPGVERLTTAFAGTSTTDGTLQEKEPDEEQTELPDTAEELTQTSQTSPTEAEPPLYALSDDVFAIAPVSPLSAESISSVLATTTTITTDDLRQDLPTYELPTPQFLDVQNLDLNPVTLASYNLATNDRTGDNRTLDRSIEEMAFQMQSSADAHELETRLRSEAVIGLAVSLTAGFVSWVLRAGSLLASFVAVLPVWRHFDPLPILSNFKSDAKKKTGAGEENPDNAEVENIFEQDGRR